MGHTQDILTKNCPHCLRSECDQIATEHRIRMHGNVGYAVFCCAFEAARIQNAETLKQQGIHGKMVSGLRRLAGIPNRFKDATLEEMDWDLANGIAFKAATEIINDFNKRESTGRGLVLLGPKGVGKTRILCALMGKLIDRGIACRYAYAADVLAMLRNRAKDSELLDMTFRELAKERVLALDDIGVDGDTDWVATQYTRLVDGRYRNNRVTLFASNLGMEDLEHAIGKRAMSRLIESNEIIQITGTDRRMQ